ncbi:acid-sensing ion channel 5 [Elysia marginata]|uniref:Acid-sensing ion channel 5 n=1 Tax=Elysia marginata TaxID=1093978 RepID=A0AAV4EKU7_9GAST|nr:acid-sensing ion channel 5 [Elysia marginata]
MLEESEGKAATPKNVLSEAILAIKQHVDSEHSSFGLNTKVEVLTKSDHKSYYDEKLGHTASAAINPLTSSISRKRLTPAVKTFLRSNPEGVVKEFPLNTSCHGFSRAWSPDRSWLERLLWLAATLLSMTILFICLYKIHENYKKYPVTLLTTISTEKKLPFPAVTICSLSELDIEEAAKMNGVKNASQKLFDLFAVESMQHGNLDTFLMNAQYNDILALTKNQVFAGKMVFRYSLNRLI